MTRNHGALGVKCRSATEKMILVSMVRAGNRSGKCYMADSKIANTACCKERTVLRIVPKLVRYGPIERVERADVRRATVTYRLRVDAPPVGQLVRDAVTSCRPKYSQNIMLSLESES
jgi:hypothetical protein